MISELQIRQPCDITLGDWKTEPESVAALDTILNQHQDLWTVRQEVAGSLVHPVAEQELKTLRIDRIVIPKQKLVDLGWKYGAVGIECKRSGEKIGPAISQSIDYTRTIYRLETGLSIWLGAVFIWPMPEQHGPLSSVMWHQRIGSASFDSHRTQFQLRLGEHNLLRIMDGQPVLANPVAHRRTGSR